MTTVQAPQKEKDIGQITRYLNNTFNKVTSDMERPWRGAKSGSNELYVLTRDFAYLIHEVMIGPRALLQYNIGKCNALIDSILANKRPQGK
jgi:hypothetical protein